VFNTVDIVFQFGVSSVSDENQAIKDEARLYDDIIQGNFTEGYWNQTHKAIMGLQWFTENCPNAKFIFKTDDDVLVNPELLKKHLDNITDPIYMGGSCRRDIVDRVSKWRVHRCEYPPDKYPLPCYGVGIIYSGKAAKMIYDATPNVPFFRLDDVYMTGLVAHEYLGIKPHDWPTIQNEWHILDGWDECYLRKEIVALHTSSEKTKKNLEKIWRKMMTGQCPPVQPTDSFLLFFLFLIFFPFLFFSLTYSPRILSLYSNKGQI